MTTVSVKERLLDAAERRMRLAGYNAVSFRDLAEDTNVKSSTVHYYFPTKGDLGAELVEHYAEQFKARLDAIDTSDLKAAISGFLFLYADALKIGQSMCLCAVLGAEANGLPTEVNEKVAAFFNMNIAWLTQLNSRHELSDLDFSPDEIVSALEGAMIVSNAKGSRHVMEKTIGRILRDYLRDAD